MKIRSSSFKHCSASTLLAALLLALIVAGTLASYLLMVHQEYRQVARSQAWNKSLMVSEAGVEEAMAFINKYEGTWTPMTSWTNSASAAADGWNVNGNVYFKSNVVSPAEGYYNVYITNVVTNLVQAPIIVSSGTAYWNYSSAAPPLTRTIYVQTRFDALIPGSLVAESTINLQGNNIMVDSFDSSDPLHSDWQTTFTYHGTNFGFYPLLDAATKRLATAVVATDQSVINVGGAEVYGYVDTAPGGTASINNNGSVGDLNWIGPNPAAPANNGIQAGHAKDDMNVNFTDQALPKVAWQSLQPTTATNIGGITYDYVITNTGNYKMGGTLTENLYVAATNVTLYLPNGINLNGTPGNTSLTIGTNDDLTIYSGDNISTSGGAAINNVNQIALAFGIYGLPPGNDTAGDNVQGCTSINVGGNGVGTGYVYAPEASLTFNGGGAGIYNVVGAYMVHDIQLNGHFAFHYDQALAIRGPNKGYVPVTWKELVGQ